MTRQVEYRGDIVSVTEALVGFPTGGQILLSDATYQHIYGRLHTVNYKDPLKKKDAGKQNKVGEADADVCSQQPAVCFIADLMSFCMLMLNR